MVEAAGVYVHLPYCRRKCAYCDFFSVPWSRPQAVRLTAALCREIAGRLPRLQDALRTVFIGGGTPSVWPEDLLGRVLEALGEHAPAEGWREYTVEANPGSLTAGVTRLLRRHGADRLSIGAQSFDDGVLETLGRGHRAGQIGEAVRRARDAGFERLNLDLIFAVPGQTLTGWRRTLDAAVALDPEHLACYGLTYEPGTPLDRQRRAGRIAAADERTEAAMYEAAIDVLTVAGYEHYEISNFARPGQRCRHNELYWVNGQYVGIGPGATSFLDGLRRTTWRDIEAYIAAMQAGREPPGDSEQLNPQARAGETAMLMLRRIDGLRFDEFAARTGVDARRHFADAIARHVAGGLLAADAAGICLTRRGLLLANEVLADFVAAPAGCG